MSNTLRTSCKEIEFELVSDSKIVALLSEISEQENVNCTDEALHTIAEKADGDVRAAVNDLQAVGSHTTDEITVDDLPTQTRDREENIFPFMDAVLKEDSPQTAQQKSRQVDETPDTLFQWIEDNIIKEYSTQELSQAYTSLSNADKWLGRVYSSDHTYKYWRYANDQMTAGVAASRNGYHGGWTRWGPPSLWRKLGSTRSARNTRSSIAEEIADEIVVSVRTAKTSIIPFLQVITHHCKPRELTVTLVSVYGFDESQLSYITGSGEDTNKVQDIVSDGSEKQLDDLVTGADSSPNTSSPTPNTTTAAPNEQNETTENTSSTETETDDEQTTLF
jgi:replication factor C large subunit